MIIKNRGRWFGSGFLLLVLALLSYVLSRPVSRTAATTGTTYYVDSVDGSDSNPGTSEDQPWRTLAPVHAHDFLPGDAVHFKCGSEWTGGLVIDDSGVEGNPIIFTAYGIGDRPVIQNPGDMTDGISIDADWVIVEGLLVRDVHHRGVVILRGSDYNTVRDMELTDVGAGVGIGGQHNLVTQNYIHDLHIVSNTPGGNDDFGAVGVMMHNSYNEVSYNTMVNCKAPSYDYVYDGGAVEWWVEEDSIEGSYVHHNWASDSDGFLEVGSHNGAVSDMVVAYNVSINNGWFGLFSLTGTFGTTVEDFRVENNTVYQVLPHHGWGAIDIFLMNDNPTPTTILVRNNIFLVDGWNVASRSGFTHDHNLYSLSGGAQLGFALGAGEMITDPLFVNGTLLDFHLQPGSPAIDAGVDLGHTLDFENRVVPAGAAPDLGAFEYGAAPAPTPTPQPTSTPAPNPGELIIDDTDSRVSFHFSQDGWQEYTEAGGQHFGDSHRYNHQIGIGEDIATWSFTVPQPGQYEVYAWWYEGSWRPNDVPYTVNHLRGSTTVRVDQQISGGQWNLLGTFDFLSAGSVTVSDDVSSGQDIVADAIRLVYVGPLPRPRFVFLPVVLRW